MSGKNPQRKVYELLDKAFTARCREKKYCDQVTEMLQEYADFKIKDCFWQPSDGYVILFANSGNLPVPHFMEIVKSKGNNVVTKNDMPGGQNWDLENDEFDI